MNLLSCSELLLVRRQGVYYLSVAAAGFLVFIIVLAILKGGRNSCLTNIKSRRMVQFALYYGFCSCLFYSAIVTLQPMRFLLFFV
jgi:hypothetical protein